MRLVIETISDTSHRVFFYTLLLKQKNYQKWPLRNSSIHRYSGENTTTTTPEEISGNRYATTKMLTVHSFKGVFGSSLIFSILIIVIKYIVQESLFFVVDTIFF